MALPLYYCIAATPRLRPKYGGMDCRTYPKRQFRAGTIVDLGHTGEKEVTMTLEDSRCYSSPVTFHS